MLKRTVQTTGVDESTALKAMWRARKEVFVDLLRWDLPVLAGEFEIDQFDDPFAYYLVLLAANGDHRASTRLLQTDRPHLLGDLYRHLCAGSPPRGPSIREITRFCLDRHQRSSERRHARNRLVTALVDHALDNAITAYTGVAEVAWFEQICEFGWQCEALGQPVRHGNSWLTALHILIERDTPARLQAGGVYEPKGLTLAVAAMGGGR
jgi:acyl homoserine lactone synthase/acyl-homoserine lactone synthase